MIRLAFLCAMVALPIFFISSLDAKALDLYRILGVDNSSNQREIQKAFHKLSLKYHPDKNKNKGAQEKFAEINNAYEILSDEGKRKNYDLYGDVQGNVGADGSNFGNREGFSHYTSGGGYFTSGPGGWQKASASGNKRSFSFPFGDGSSAGGSPVFDLGDLFSKFFQTSGGLKSGNHYSDFSSSNSRSKSEFSASGNIQDVNLHLFNKKIKDKGMTWLLLFYTPSAKGYNVFESIVSDVANSLHGAVEAGKINCQTERTLCRDLGLPSPRKVHLFIYGYGSSAMGSLLEYKGGLDARSLKTFCLEHLPKVSKRVDLNNFEFPNTKGNLPQVLLLSTRKDTPVIWRSVSGLLQKRFAFYDAEVHDIRHPFTKELEVEALPALVGKLSNGEPYVLKAGIAVKDLQSGINELKSVLEGFERKISAAASRNSHGKNTPLLTASNADTLCGDSTPVCFIGVFRSRKAKDKLNDVLSALSRKTLVRKQYYEGESFSFSLLDAETQSQALASFHNSRFFKSSDMLILAYKPKKGKFVSLSGEMKAEEIDKFVGSVLNGDLPFNKVHQTPAFR